MRHVSEVLADWLEDRDDIPGGWEDGAPWFGDPWYFDVRCQECGVEFVNVSMFCPVCGAHESEAVPVA